MRKGVITAGFLLVLALSFGTIAYSSEDSISELEMRKYKGIRYVSGGIGKSERQALQGLANDYSLRLAFAVKGGAYLYKVKVTLRRELMNRQKRVRKEEDQKQLKKDM